MRGYCLSSRSLCRPYFAPKSKSASSVGSPIRCPPCNEASLHKSIPLNSSGRMRCSPLPPVPVTSSIISYHQHFSTVSRFWVSVPVLSEQTTLTAPSVSTEGSLRMIVCTLTILVTDKARQIVTTAGSPSGTAATASEIATRSISGIFLC